MNEGYLNQMVSFKDGINYLPSIKPCLGRVFKTVDVSIRRDGKFYVRLEGHPHPPYTWISVDLLDFWGHVEDRFDFTKEERDHYDRAFKSLFLNA